MSDAPTRQRRTWFLWAPVLLLLAYLLSIGPAYSHALHSPSGRYEARKMLDTIYAPIVWVARHSASTRKAFDWYLGWWQ